MVSSEKTQKNTLSLTQLPPFYPRPKPRGERCPRSGCQPTLRGARHSGRAACACWWLGSPFPACGVPPRAPWPLQWLSHPNYVSSWFLIVPYQPTEICLRGPASPGNRVPWDRLLSEALGGLSKGGRHFFLITFLTSC